MKRAKKHDKKKISKLFSDINKDIGEKDIEKLIEDKQVLILKKRKKLKAAFAYTTIGIAGIFSIMYIKKIAVAKDQRGRGIGSSVLGYIKSLSQKKGTSILMLYSLVKARNFYKKNKLKNIWNFFWWENKEKK